VRGGLPYKTNQITPAKLHKQLKLSWLIIVLGAGQMQKPIFLFDTSPLLTLATPVIEKSQLLNMYYPISKFALLKQVIAGIG
jgi:hypothetical protein